MHWADKLTKEIIDSKKYLPYWVDDMKTPSGFAHVGSLRGPLIHSVMFRALRDAGQEAKFTFVFNDFDPADEFPPEFKDELSIHAGKALKEVPSPDPKFENLADLLADDLKTVMKNLGCEAEFLSSWEMYKAGKFDGVIKLALDHAEEIQEIYQRVSGSAKKEKGWLPFQAICANCGKLGTTRVYAWDGKEVSYICEPDMVSWAKGCGHEGKVSPFGGTGKLPWKVDWSAHWKVVGVTIEGAGKDHASKGGSYDIAMEICEKVFGYAKPFKIPYEFFLIGGKKMSSSKGLGNKAHDITKMLPAEIARFLFTRTRYQEQIDFDPVETMAIPDLFDEYDRCWDCFVSGADENLSRAFEFAQVSSVPKKEKIFLPRFRDVVNYLQNAEKDLVKKFAEVKGSELTKDEKDILEERLEYAKVWLDNYAPEDFKVVMKDEAPKVNLDGEQKKFLSDAIALVEKDLDEESLQKELYELAKSSGVDIKKAFSSIYMVFIGKDFGPRAGAFLLSYPKEKVIERLKESSK